jgi:hypothetical protein
MNNVVMVVLMIGAYLGVPIVLVSGWFRWWRRSEAESLVSRFALAGFVAGSASAALALGSVIYSLAIGGFPYWDPRLIRIYGVGLLLSLGAMALSLGGTLRRNALRWHAPALSAGMLILWVLWMGGE